METQEIFRNKVIDYLKMNKVFLNVDHIERMVVGSGGAQLYIIKDNCNEYVLKISGRNNNSAMLNEIKFYSLNKNFKFVPKIIYTENHSDYGVIIIMKKYQSIRHDEWNYNLQLKAVDLCAKLNSTNKDIISKLGLEFKSVTLNNEFLKKSYDDWKYVVYKYNWNFDTNIIDEIYKKLGIVCPILNNGYHYLCHGDFHPDNFLLDNGNLLLCDWQNINVSKGIGDISFFIDRAIGFGINIDEEEIINNYCFSLSKYMNGYIQKDTLLKEKSASALLNIFSYWAYYLKNCSKEKILPYLNKMINSFLFLQKY